MPGSPTDYIYGSAIVVGYFLAHIYEYAPGATLAGTYASASDLAIALQLTNFARDVWEDHGRERLYLPLDILTRQGLTPQNYLRPENKAALRRAIATIAQRAEEHYDRAARTVHVFSADTRTAITACIDVYRQLNNRLLASGGDPLTRQSVPVSEEFRVSSWWRCRTGRGVSWKGRR